jgi:hypothetical protein
MLAALLACTPTHREPEPVRLPSWLAEAEATDDAEPTPLPSEPEEPARGVGLYEWPPNPLLIPVKLPECEIEEDERGTLHGHVVAQDVLEVRVGDTVERLCWSSKLRLGRVPSIELHVDVKAHEEWVRPAVAWFFRIHVDLLPIRKAFIRRFGGQHEAIEIRLGKDLTPVRYPLVDPYSGKVEG